MICYHDTKAMTTANTSIYTFKIERIVIEKLWIVIPVRVMLCYNGNFVFL